MKKQLLFICALIVSASLYAGDIVNDPGMVAVPPSLAPSIKTVSFTFSIEGLGDGAGGGIIVNSSAGWDPVEWGISGTGGDAGKPIIPEYDGANTLTVTRDVEGYDYGEAAYVEYVIQHWWGATLTFVQFKAYDAEGKVVFALPEDVEEPSEPTLSLDFENEEVGTKYAVVGWYETDISATVAANPAGEGNSLKVEVGNWNSAPRFPTITLPDGCTLNDVEKITFDIYLDESSADIQWKTVDFWFGAKGATFGPNTPNGSYENMIKTDEKNAWLAKELTWESIGLTDESVLGLNAFDMAFGLGLSAGNMYYLDNIAFVLRDDPTSIRVPVENNIVPIYSIAGGIEVANDGVKVVVYGIDGREVLQTTDSRIYLEKGIYLVQIGNSVYKTVVR